MVDTTARAKPFDAPLMQRPPAATPAASPPPPPASEGPPSSPGRIFAADRPEADAAEAGPATGRLAELVVHRGAETPFTIGIVGGPGTGKSGILAQLARRANALSRAAEGKTSPFLPGLVTVAFSAVELGAEPAKTIVERLHVRIGKIAPDAAAEAAEQANHASHDPHTYLRTVTDRLDGARRRLDAERKSRDEAESRRARLPETVLYETASSRVDAYARANRGSIETALGSFGLAKGDVLANYKGLVHTLYESGGPARRALSSVSALWAFRGQTKLLVWAVVFFLAAWAFGHLQQDPSWLDPLQGGGETLQKAGDAVRSRIGWLNILRQASILAGLLCLAACLWRAIRFSRPLLRGASLVDADLAVRRTELDNLVAHHAQRVEALAAEVDGLQRRVTEAERRAAGAQPAVPTPAFLSEAVSPDRAPRAYLAALDASLAGAATPRRVLALLDDLDRLPAAQGLDTLERVVEALSGRSFVLAAAFDADRLVRALGSDAANRLERLVQVPYRAGRDLPADWRKFVAALSAAPAGAAPQGAPDPSRSALDTALDEKEQRLLAGLASLAGPSPRGVKRFINLYRLGRHDAAGDLASFALALALAIGGTSAEASAFRQAVASGEASQPVRREGFAPRIQAALDLVATLQGHSVSYAEARRAQTLAEQWVLVER